MKTKPMIRLHPREKAAKVLVGLLMAVVLVIGEALVQDLFSSVSSAAYAQQEQASTEAKIVAKEFPCTTIGELKWGYGKLELKEEDWTPEMQEFCRDHIIIECKGCEKEAGDKTTNHTYRKLADGFYNFILPKVDGKHVDFERHAKQRLREMIPAEDWIKIEKEADRRGLKDTAERQKWFEVVKDYYAVVKYGTFIKQVIVKTKQRLPKIIEEQKKTLQPYKHPRRIVRLWSAYDKYPDPFFVKIDETERRFILMHPDSPELKYQLSRGHVALIEDKLQDKTKTPNGILLAIHGIYLKDAKTPVVEGHPIIALLTYDNKNRNFRPVNHLFKEETKEAMKEVVRNATISRTIDGLDDKKYPEGRETHQDKRFELQEAATDPNIIQVIKRFPDLKRYVILNPFIDLEFMSLIAPALGDPPANLPFFYVKLQKEFEEKKAIDSGSKPRPESATDSKTP